MDGGKKSSAEFNGGNSNVGGNFGRTDAFAINTSDSR
jgi:hypothetical protein